MGKPQILVRHEARATTPKVDFWSPHTHIHTWGSTHTHKTHALSFLCFYSLSFYKCLLLPGKDSVFKKTSGIETEWEEGESTYFSFQGLLTLVINASSQLFLYKRNLGNSHGSGGDINEDR